MFRKVNDYRLLRVLALLQLQLLNLRALTSLLIGCDTNGALDSGTVPRSVKSKADNSRLEETVSKRKKSSN